MASGKSRTSAGYWTERKRTKVIGGGNVWLNKVQLSVLYLTQIRPAIEDAEHGST